MADASLDEAAAPSTSNRPISLSHIPMFSAQSASEQTAEHGQMWLAEFLNFLEIHRLPRDRLTSFFMAAMSGIVARTWLFQLKKEQPAISADDLVIAFNSRFAVEVRKASTISRDRLHSGKVCMTSGMDVAAYVQMFKDVTDRCRSMSTPDIIHWFSKGLSPQLRLDCICDTDGHEFTNLDDLITFAHAQERRAKLKQSMTSARPAVASLQAKPDPTFTTVKKQTSNNRNSNRGGSSNSAGPSNSQRKRKFSGAELDEASNVHALDGKLLSRKEFYKCMDDGVCFNCFKKGHRSKDCKADPKAFPDS